MEGKNLCLARSERYLSPLYPALMIKPLTSLRFAFAFMVFLCHLKFIQPEQYPVLDWLNRHVFYELSIGVSFFFILSGFILSHSYQSRLLSGNTSNASFYQARFARIYPLHFVTLIAAIPLSLPLLGRIGILAWAARFLNNLTLTQSFVPVHDVYFSFNAPSWSISCEMFFYLCFPLLVRWLAKPGKAVFLTFALLVIGLLISMLVVNKEAAHAWFYVNPFIRILDFILGILLYQGAAWLRRNYLITRFTRLELLSLVLFMAFFACHEWIPEVFRYAVFYWIPMCTLILVFSFQGGWFSRQLSSKALVYLGEISFGFYLTHLLVIQYINLLNSKFHLVSSNWLLTAIQFALALGLSIASYHLLEKPANRWLKFVGRPRANLKSINAITTKTLVNSAHVSS